ncbi:MAG: gluconate 2-dehydrogenase subunit 3 family protein [Candidatus Eremiobacteraeota bacterium]|nr:gluconate 2-dehydrogenase subunit 3 family protein [Candidatus Eremiobacteraeota bacterium]MBV8223055.1 gluconate 2-dehydrogenase subunit 3 family protein [Candidatus Eremiobacteraeota bacterium]
MADEIKRREFVAIVGVLGATAVAGCSSTAPQQSAQNSAAAPSNGAQAQKALATEPEAFTFLTPPEQAFVSAACDRIIPAEPPGPSASQAGVPYYIDHQLAGAWGNGARMYRPGPWRQGTPEQGYQLALVPAEVYRAAIRAIDEHCNKKYNGNFSGLTPAQQDEALGGLEKGSIDLGVIPATTFFSMLLANTIEGYFADPLYGGNRDKAGWKMIGFPGVAAVYTRHIDQDYGKQYVVPPVSIADVQQGLVQDDMDQMHVAMVRAMQPRNSFGKGR